MTHRWLLLGALALGLPVTACTLEGAAPEETADTASHALEGAWSVRALEDLNTCPEFGSMAPVGPGALTIEEREGAWFLSARDIAEPVRYESAEATRWTRSVAGPYEGCELEAEADWVFDAVDANRFSSRYSAAFRVFGQACGYPQERCQVAYTVVGTRR
jgi:hypothetical protein